MGNTRAEGTRNGVGFGIIWRNTGAGGARVRGGWERMDRAGEFLAWLGGADLRVLRQAGRDRGRFAQMGGVLLTTAAIAAVSMAFAIHDAVGLPVWAAVLVGVFWGLVILNLDRFLVVSMGAIRNRRRLLLMALPRLVLAAVIALVIATPFSLEIFRNDINAQVAVMNQAASLSINQQVQEGPLQAQADRIQAKITADEAILAGHLPTTVTSPQLQAAQSQVRTLQPQVTAAQQQVAKTYGAYLCALTGQGTGCTVSSGMAGNGPIAQALKKAYDNAQANYNSLKQQLTQAEADLSAAQASVDKQQTALLAASQRTAQGELPGLRSQLAALEGQIQQQVHAADQSVTANTGILAQLTALFQASSGNLVLGTANALVAALFFLIGLLPVIVKLLLNFGPLTAYEQLIEAEDAMLAYRLELERVVERRRMDRAMEHRAAFADAGPDSQSLQLEPDDVAGRGSGYARDRMAESLDIALEQWNSQIRTALDAAPGLGLRVEEIEHPDGLLQRFELGSGEFLLVDRMGGRPTLNWTTSISPRNFAELVAEYIDDDAGEARMAIGIGGVVDEASAEMGIELARSSGLSFDLKCTFLRCDTRELDLAYQVLPGSDDSKETRILGVSATRLALGQVLPLIVRTGTGQVSAQALNVRPGSLPARLSSVLVTQGGHASSATSLPGGGYGVQVNLGIDTPVVTEAGNEA